jgi:hypothetical protein
MEMGDRVDRMPSGRHDPASHEARKPDKGAVRFIRFQSKGVHMRNVLIGTLAAVLSVSTAVAAEAVPKDWILSGAADTDYVANVDHATFHGGKASAHYKSKDDHPKDFGTLMQVSDAKAFTGKRVILTAFVKTAKVAGTVGVWMRVDGKDGEMIALDNMDDRPIKGNSNWKEYSVVLDVPKDSKDLAYGVLIQGGAGELWIDDVKLAVAPKGTPVTHGPQERPTQHVPLPAASNLGFEK